MDDKEETALIKKYSNRRLYNTHISQYITHKDLLTMINEEQPFRIMDAKTKEDITKIVLTQLIFEQEQEGYSLLPEALLMQIIKFNCSRSNENPLNFLAQSANQFINSAQESAESTLTPMKIFGEITKKNFELFGKSMSIFAQNTSGERKNE
jgi:polyhydroxyalkanoate synthesis repressor PhaR